MWTVLISLLSCSGSSTAGDSATQDSGLGTSSTADSAGSGDPALKGCISGRARDFNNASATNLAIDTYNQTLCEPLASTTTTADGNFCLDDLPVGETIVVQATFVERCPWSHSREATILVESTCDAGDCLVLDTWYECDGESAICP
jgi:hypothetical protein